MTEVQLFRDDFTKSPDPYSVDQTFSNHFFATGSGFLTTTRDDADGVRLDVGLACSVMPPWRTWIKVSSLGTHTPGAASFTYSSLILRAYGTDAFLDAYHAIVSWEGDGMPALYPDSFFYDFQSVPPYPPVERGQSVLMAARRAFFNPTFDSPIVSNDIFWTSPDFGSLVFFFDRPAGEDHTFTAPLVAPFWVQLRAPDTTHMLAEVWGSEPTLGGTPALSTEVTTVVGPVRRIQIDVEASGSLADPVQLEDWTFLGPPCGSIDTGEQLQGLRPRGWRRPSR